MINNSGISLALILGSGIDVSDEIVCEKNIYSVDTSGIHKKIIYGCRINNSEVLVFKGRKHFYEGWGQEDIISSIHLANYYGVKNILITNAAGGLNPNFKEGDLMLITSHIDFNNRLISQKPLQPVSNGLQEKFRKACRRAKIKLHEGTYGFYQGPAYETKAEIRMQRKYNLDSAGMSTIPEIYAASRLGMAVVAVSVITNLLKESGAVPASHEDVLATAKSASAKLNKCLPLFINELN